MKKIYSLLSFVAVLSGGLFTGCNDAEYTALDNSVYLTDAAVSLAKSKVVTMWPSGATVAVAVRLAQPVDYDVEVVVKIDASLLNAYNAQYNTAYIHVPAEYIHLPANATAVIKAQEVSGVLNIQIDNFETNNQPYCIAVTLDGVRNAGMAQSATLSSFVYLINKPLIQSVPHIIGSNTLGVPNGQGHTCSIAGEWNILCTVWTMEFWMRMDDLTTANQTILEFHPGGPIGSDYVYLCWGDARNPKNIFRVKKGNNEIYTEGILEVGKWTHYAIVNDETLVTIYINGEATNFAPLGGPQILGAPGGMWQGLKNAYFCQFRIWSTARTQTEIRNNMPTEVDPADPNLIAYWKANEGAGGVLHDATGNERHWTIMKNNESQADANLEWLPDVSFE
jgi:hypothetical protein